MEKKRAHLTRNSLPVSPIIYSVERDTIHFLFFRSHLLTFSFLYIGVFAYSLIDSYTNLLLLALLKLNLLFNNLYIPCDPVDVPIKLKYIG